MIIFFGTRGRTIAGPRKQGIPCSACGKDEHATYGVLRYFHVFWIPLFPTAKHVAMECLNCKKASIGKEIPERTRAEIAGVVLPGRRVAATFSGLILAAAFVLFVVVVGGGESKRQDSYLRNPAPGDYYVVKLASIVKDADAAHPYGVLQAASVEGGEVELRVGSYGYSSAAGARKAIRSGDTAKPDYFGAGSMAVRVEALPRLKADGTIASVKRL